MKKNKPKYGYCAVTADILHVGHIKQIRRCARLCEKLIVGVMTDDIVFHYKGHYPIIPYSQRAEIIKSLKLVHKVIPQNNFEFVKCTQLMVMKGVYEKDFIIFDCSDHRREGADICFPYTKGISSSLIKQRIYENLNNR